MKTWEEFKNQSTIKTIGYGQYQIMDVACPKCGKPIYKDLTCVLASYPPQHRYICLDCGWVGAARD